VRLAAADTLISSAGAVACIVTMQSAETKATRVFHRFSGGLEWDMIEKGKRFRWSARCWAARAHLGDRFLSHSEKHAHPTHFYSQTRLTILSPIHYLECSSQADPQYVVVSAPSLDGNRWQ
jgi:hypothetical protein